ncbi:MAG: hypothetical protein WDA59_11555 [Methanofastidiosum sp.]
MKEPKVYAQLNQKEQDELHAFDDRFKAIDKLLESLILKQEQLRRDQDVWWIRLRERYNIANEVPLIINDKHQIIEWNKEEK